MWHVYLLADPRDHVPRYVGTTTIGVQPRLLRHVGGARSLRGTRKDDWVRDMLADGVRPVARTVEEHAGAFVEGHGDAREAEWLSLLLLAGLDPVNTGNVYRAKSIADIPDEGIGPGARAAWKALQARRMTPSDLARALEWALPTLNTALYCTGFPSLALRGALETWSGGDVPAALWGDAPRRGPRCGADGRRAHAAAQGSRAPQPVQMPTRSAARP